MSDSVQQMRDLIADLDHHQRETTDAYRYGFADGFADGFEIGYGRRLVEEADEWRAHREAIHGISRERTGEERNALDAAYAAGIPCTPRHASGCSRCIRADAVARRGGDYQGGPVEWEPRRRGREVA